MNESAGGKFCFQDVPFGKSFDHNYFRKHLWIRIWMILITKQTKLLFKNVVFHLDSSSLKANVIEFLTENFETFFINIQISFAKKNKKLEMSLLWRRKYFRVNKLFHLCMLSFVTLTFKWHSSVTWHFFVTKILFFALFAFIWFMYFAYMIGLTLYN